MGLVFRLGLEFAVPVPWASSPVRAVMIVERCFHRLERWRGIAARYEIGRFPIIGGHTSGRPTTISVPYPGELVKETRLLLF